MRSITAIVFVRTVADVVLVPNELSGYDRLISDLTSQQRSASRTAPKQQQQQQQLQQQASDDKENDAVGRLVACSDDASECDDGVIDAPDAAAPADAANTADAAVVRSSSASDFLQLVASPAVTGKRRR